MVFHGLRSTDDCGLQTRLLAASNALHRPVYPRCLMAGLCLGEAAVVLLWTLALLGALWVLP